MRPGATLLATGRQRPKRRQVGALQNRYLGVTKQRLLFYLDVQIQ